MKVSKRVSSYSQEFESKILGFNIGNYLNAIMRNCPKILDKNVANDENEFLYNADIERIKSVLEQSKHDFLERINEKIKRGVFDEKTVLKERYFELYLFLTESDLIKIKDYSNRFIRGDGNEYHDVLDTSFYLCIISEIQTIYEMLQESEPAKVNSNRERGELVFSVELARQLGIHDLLLKTYNPRETAVILRRLFGFVSPVDTSNTQGLINVKPKSTRTLTEIDTFLHEVKHNTDKFCTKYKKPKK